MKKKNKVLKVLSTVAICSMIFTTAGNKTFASSNDITGEAVSAYYIKEGENIYIPKEDYVKLFDQNSIYNLPGDVSVEENQETTITPYQSHLAYD